MAERSKIKRLPADVRKKVEDALAEGRATYDEIVDFLSTEGHEVSRSSVHRFDQGFQETLRQMRETREMVAAFVRENEQFGELLEGQFGEVLRDMFQQIVFRQLKAQVASGAPDIKAMDLMLTAKALKEVEGVLKISADTKKRNLEIDAMQAEAQAEKAMESVEPETGPTFDLPGNGR